LLAKEVALQYPGQVEFVDEDYGQSAMAARFGLKQYPVFFVDDVLVAQPRDLSPGFGDTGGKYVPLSSKEKSDAFKLDLKRVIDLVLAGKGDEARKLGETKMDATFAQTLPKLTLTDLDGKSLRTEDLSGKTVLVEFWATWCPPCRSTLTWLQSIQAELGQKVVVLAIAVDSPDADVRKFVADQRIRSRVVIGDAKVGAAFGNVSSLPQVFIYDPQGKLKDMVLGAPPDAHERIERDLRGTG
jgi:thiol-disulfide isomerase/thioredoxin